MKAIDMHGKRFGKLTIRNRAPKNTSGEAHWLCDCDCGRISIVRGANLRNGWTQSCGCLHIERSREATTTHGHAGHKTASREYRSWASMIARCENPNYHHFHRYGGRGIKVCDRWRSSFADFLADMKTRPHGTTLDRIDNDGNYEPSNCRWANHQEQRLNRSDVVSFERVK
jgi:hypothetical protein